MASERISLPKRSRYVGYTILLIRKITKCMCRIAQNSHEIYRELSKSIVSIDAPNHFQGSAIIEYQSCVVIAEYNKPETVASVVT